jgi:Zn-dependent metalloprotease
MRPVFVSFLIVATGCQLQTAVERVEEEEPRIAGEPLGADQRAVLLARTTERVGRALDVLRPQLGSAMELAIRNQLTDQYGTTHTRLFQTYRGVPIWGSEVITHIDARDAVLRHTGNLLHDEDLLSAVHTEPSISGAHAVARVQEDLAPAIAKNTLSGELLILPRSEKTVRSHSTAKRHLNALDMEKTIVGYTLVYRIDAHIRSAKYGIASYIYLIDAHDGTILSREDSMPRMGDYNLVELPTPNGHAQHSGDVFVPVTQGITFWELRDPNRGGMHPFLDEHEGGNEVMNMEGEDPDESYATAFYDDDNNWGDGTNFSLDDLGADPGATGVAAQTAAVDVAFGIMVTWDLLDRVFGQEGIDGVGSAIIGNVHAMPSAPNMAYWDPLWLMPFFSDLIEPQVQPTATDVVGHELAHGLFQYIVGSGSPMPRGGEFGGINEANGDIFGTLVEFYATLYPFGASTVIPSTGGNWLVGEKVIKPPYSYRYMYMPSLDGDGFNAWFPEIGAAGNDPHDIAGPINRMFYFLSQGALPQAVDGQRSTPYLPDGFEGVGIDVAAQIWFRAISTHLTVGDDFAALREACLAAASERYGAYSIPYLRVMDAFAAVNVGEPADRDGPKIAISQRRSAYSVTVIVDIEDDSPIESVGYSMSGQNQEGETLSYGAVTYDIPGTRISFSFDWFEVYGYTFRFNVSVTDSAHNTASKGAIIDVTPPVNHQMHFDGTPKHPIITLEAQDDRGFGKTEAYVDGVLYQTVWAPFRLPEMELYLPGADDGVPQPPPAVWEEFGFDFDMTTWSTATHEILFVVYDASGNTDDWTIYQYVDNTPPAVTPSVSGSRDTILLRASVTDSSAPEFVRSKFYVDNAYVCTRFGYSVSCDFNSRTVANGNHTLKVVADDGWGNVRTVSISFAVNNVEQPDPPDPDPPPAWFYEQEPNDSISGADIVPTNALGILGGIPTTGPSRDYFRITLPAGGRLRMAFDDDNTNILCFWWGIYDSRDVLTDGQVFIPEVDQWGRQVVNNTTGPINYYVRISPRTDVCQNWGSYRVHLFVD